CIAGPGHRHGRTGGCRGRPGWTRGPGWSGSRPLCDQGRGPGDRCQPGRCSGDGVVGSRRAPAAGTAGSAGRYHYRRGRRSLSTVDFVAFSEDCAMNHDHSTTHAEARLRATGLGLAYGRSLVIDALDLTLPDGQVTAIVGPNGCGKSTLLSGLARLHAPNKGAVLLDGADIQSLPAREVARRIALLPQDTQAPEGLTVSELIRFGRQPHQGWLRQWSAQ